MVSSLLLRYEDYRATPLGLLRCVFYEDYRATPLGLLRCDLRQYRMTGYNWNAPWSNPTLG